RGAVWRVGPLRLAPRDHRDLADQKGRTLMRITRDLVKSKGACADGLAWFESWLAGRADADYQELLDALVDAGHESYAEWLLKAVGAIDATLTIDAASWTRRSIFAAGRLVIRGHLALGGGIKAGGGI